MAAPWCHRGRDVGGQGGASSSPVRGAVDSNGGGGGGGGLDGWRPRSHDARKELLRAIGREKSYRRSARTLFLENCAL